MSCRMVLESMKCENKLNSLIDAAGICRSLPVSFVSSNKSIGLFVRQKVIKGHNPRRLRDDSDAVMWEFFGDVCKHPIEITRFVNWFR
mmetsp:Transcript_18222/g.26307  ORF Transcript_18222/g.26307 Transcript_18222/m.26307 type:complete len:88 (-) Transcript_18222:457-720(-)